MVSSYNNTVYESTVETLELILALKSVILHCSENCCELLTVLITMWMQNNSPSHAVIGKKYSGSCADSVLPMLWAALKYRLCENNTRIWQG